MEYLKLNQIIDIDGVINTQKLSTINSIIQALLITRQGTIPGSRSFGLPGLFVDSPPPAAASLIAVDLAEQIDKYAPDVHINRVEINQTGEDGVLGLTVYVGGA